MEEVYDKAIKKDFVYCTTEQCRKLIHEKKPFFTLAEVKECSDKWFDIERKLANNEITEEEAKSEREKLDNYYAKLEWEHSFDDIKEVHQFLPYLTVDECKEWLECYKKFEPYKDSFMGKILVIKELMRGWQLEEINNYRRDNIGSIFD